MLAAGAASFATGFGALAALPDDRDAELLALLARFDALERQIIANPLGEEEDTGSPKDRLVADLHEAQARLYPAIIGLPTFTTAGVKARARSLALWAPDLLHPRDKVCWGDQLGAAILRGALTLPG